MPPVATQTLTYQHIQSFDFLLEILNGLSQKGATIHRLAWTDYCKQHDSYYLQITFTAPDIYES